MLIMKKTLISLFLGLQVCFSFAQTETLEILELTQVVEN